MQILKEYEIDQNRRAQDLFPTKRGFPFDFSQHSEGLERSQGSSCLLLPRSLSVETVIRIDDDLPLTSINPTANLLVRFSQLPPPCATSASPRCPKELVETLNRGQEEEKTERAQCCCAMK